MKMHSFRRHPRRGSALLAVMTVLVILTFAAAGVIDYSLNTYRNTQRQVFMDQAKEIADSEMEFLFYAWKSALLLKNSVASVSTDDATGPLVANGFASYSAPGNQSAAMVIPTTPTAANVPFSSAMAGAGWQVARSVVYNKVSGTGDGSAQGLIPGSQQQTGKNYYFTAETMATLSSPLWGTVTVHSGRHFVYSSTSLYQYAVFYQGNLELAAGGNMTITGPISTNASAYVGSQPGYTLTVSDSFYYFQDFNGAADPLTGETQRLEGSGALDDPVYNPNPEAAAPANQAAQRAQQVIKMASQSSFIGGVDVAADIANYPSAYTNLQGVVDPNEVYRAVIAPPPTDANGNLIPEDPVVADSRLYNTAGLLITVTEDSSGVNHVHYGYASSNAATLSAYDTAITTTETALGVHIVPTVRTLEADPRELIAGTNGVNLTTLDVGALNAVLQTVMPANATLQTAYNGVVYVHDNTNNANVPTSPQAPGAVNGVLLQNGATTPNFSDPNGNPLGFTVVSNNGVYVKGDYNTTQITLPSVGQVNNPAAVMGDAITAVSQGWTPSSTLAPISARQSNADGTSPTMTINAAILTGNTPSTTSTNSGGVQNLVRMIEDWYDPVGSGSGLTLVLNGSLGQLFTSKYFTGKYVGNGINPIINDRVYLQPKTRTFDYDTAFKTRTPAGSPTTTNFYRGDFFFW